MSEEKHEIVTQENQGSRLPANPIELLSMAVERDIDTDKLRELMTLEKEWRADKAKAEFAEAMSKFASLQSTIPHNRKGKTAGNAPFSYADYPQVVKTITPWLAECGLSFSHHEGDPVFNEQGYITCIMVYCTIKHIAGHSETYQYPAVPDERLKGKVSPSQLIQLAITYAKRQTLAMALGLATSEDTMDDDAMTPDETISDQQVADLEALIEDVGADRAAFLKYLKVDSLDEILVKNYGKCVQLLEAKRNKS